MAFPLSALVATSHPLPTGIYAILTQGCLSQSRESPGALSLGKQIWPMFSLCVTFLNLL